MKMQLIYLDIFQDNYNIVRDRFETDSVNVMKNRPLVPKKQRKLQKYTSLVQSKRETMKIVNRNNNTQIFRRPYWFETNPCATS